MYWADELAASLRGPQVVNDSKSPSGTVHVGSLRGVVLHDAIHRALLGAGVESKFLYGVDDMDAMDSAALLTPDAIERYMGAPLSRVPAPEGSSAANYARHFVGEIFFRTFEPLGIRPEFYWVSELYAAGQMDKYVKLALDRADRVREIYMRVSHVDRPSIWLPIQVICEQCGKIGTTYATDWDGSTVAYQCKPDMVAWAKGCGHEGRVSPLGGNAKLPWNLEWAAQWGLFGVTIEPNGKDLATAGGSRDRSDAISREVFDREPPRNFPYEFLNIGGRKMSTSKGRGAAAYRFTEVVPAEQTRFLFVRQRPESAIEFDPEGTDAIPRLFDEFDRLGAATAGREVKGELPSGHESIFRYSLLDPAADVASSAAAFRPAFAHLALLVQVPGVDVVRRVAAEKGAPLTSAEAAELDERLAAVRRWLEAYAPERARIEIRRDALPPEAASLLPEQRGYLAALAAATEGDAPASGEAWQTAIFAAAAERGLDARAAFNAIYLTFLGRANGPRAGWLLASLDHEFVIGRLREAGAAVETGEATA